MKLWLRQWWEILRHLAGEDAYARYLAHWESAHPGIQPLSRNDFYRNYETRKWNGVRRCC